MRLQSAVHAAPHDQALGKLIHHLIEVLGNERVPLLPPPLTNDSAREHDQIPAVLLTVDDDVPEAVLGDPRHGPPLPRSELSKRYCPDPLAPLCSPAEVPPGPKSEQRTRRRLRPIRLVLGAQRFHPPGSVRHLDDLNPPQHLHPRNSSQSSEYRSTVSAAL